MKQIRAELVDHMGSDLSVVNAARVSYGAESHEFSERDSHLINFLAKHKHVTPFRHPQITLRCHAPIFLARQLGKHQAGFSWNEVSRRYKDGEAIAIECYVPENVYKRPEKLMTQTAQLMPFGTQNCAVNDIRLANRNAIEWYEMILNQGVAPEQARMVLPQGMMTEWIWTGSLYGWANMYNQRSTEHAQYEARLFAKEVDAIMRELFPICWAALVGEEK